MSEEASSDDTFTGLALRRQAGGLHRRRAVGRRQETIADMRTRTGSAILALVGAASAPSATACTLFAAAGPRVQGGGVLIGKTRDWRPIQTHTLRRVADSGAFP